MANVLGKFYSATTQRRGVTPASPPNAVDEPVNPLEPVNTVSFLSLTDTPNTYVSQGLKGVRVNLDETDLEFYDTPTVDVLGTPLTGYTVGGNTPLADSDTILGAFQKIQGQINARVTGSGVAGQVAFFNSNESVAGSANLTFQDTQNTINLSRSSGNVYSRYTTIQTGVDVLIGASTVDLRISAISNHGIRFLTNNTTRWDITNTGILQSNGAQIIQTSTGDLTLKTRAGNGSILLDNHGTGRVRIVGGIDNAAGNFLTTSATGVIQQRTGAQVLLDLGLGTAVTGSGTVGFLPVYNGVNTLTNSSIFRSATSRTNVFGFNATSTNGVLNASLSVVGELGPFENHLLWLRTLNNNVSGTPTIPLRILRLERDGLSGSTFPSVVEFGIARYEVSAQNSRTELTIAMGHNQASSTDRNLLKIRSSGEFIFFDGSVFNTGPTTGLKIGGATSQKLSFWNATPITQPLETALSNSPNTGDANTDALISSLKNIILNTGLGRAS